MSILSRNTMALSNLFLSAGVTVSAFVLWKIAKLLIAPYTSTLRNLPGPPSPSWFYGNFKQIFAAENSVLHEAWVEEYGQTLKYKGMFSRDRFFTMDTRALQHILSHSNIYQKGEQARYNLSQIVGDGLLVVEDDEHKKQRRVMNPAFGLVHIREMTDIFLDKSIQLRDIWSSIVSSKEEPVRIDALSWLSRMTLDVIGLAGFNYQFNSLNTDEKPSELSQAFSTMFEAGQEFSILPFLQAFIPPLRIISSERSRRIAGARRTMARIGRQLLDEKKAAVTASLEKNLNGGEIEVDKKSVQGRDLMSLLVRANMATDLPENQRMTDEDVLAQVPTFLTAGHETTSTGTTWALYALSLSPSSQSKLRQELLSVPTDTPTMDQLQSLPYLDAVVRETMRVHAPVPTTIRVAMQDDVIPLNSSVVDRNGVTLNEVRISKGDAVLIPILAINRSKEIWGEDAREFKPERWENPPSAISTIPGVWGNVLSFLGGPHACIGYRFSVVETKAILFTLLRSFEFELAVPKEDIIKKTSIVQRPIVTSEKEKKNQMPLFVRPYRGE
ncbi:hypothetical protein JAAARDRAFT_160998 [Jaapia argillacea MUCL 33604]|uniref:Cytochrome P450 n=1 Tax=Jaapia argillacea MUCL 33604 TaxID=933084 RepID=A0A067PJP4_9AGAM|nr:hypothetical protein JAAARDRAFT_160998 [Jaapia argillacea MUCL 33604]